MMKIFNVSRMVMIAVFITCFISCEQQEPEIENTSEPDSLENAANIEAKIGERRFHASRQIDYATFYRYSANLSDGARFTYRSELYHQSKAVLKRIAGSFCIRHGISYGKTKRQADGLAFLLPVAFNSFFDRPKSDALRDLKLKKLFFFIRRDNSDMVIVTDRNEERNIRKNFSRIWIPASRGTRMDCNNAEKILKIEDGYADRDTTTMYIHKYSGDGRVGLYRFRNRRSGKHLHIADADRPGSEIRSIRNNSDWIEETSPNNPLGYVYKN